jgi:xanthine dehydrogenase FAD-binding subunit
MLTCDDYLTPGSLDEAFNVMTSNRGRHGIIAGATDTLPGAREGIGTV